MAAKTIYITPEQYEIGEKNGIDRHRVYQRVNYDLWSIERAITTPIRRGSLYRKWENVCKENGVGHSTFDKRIRKGWTPEEAASKRYPKTKITAEHKALAAKNGIPENTFKCRVYQYKWTPERAATEPINTKFRKGGWR